MKVRNAQMVNTIVIMTTNTGAQDMSRASMGFQSQDHTSDATEMIKKTFSPEFRNRLDGIIPVSYTHLTLPTNREV